MLIYTTFLFYTKLNEGLVLKTGEILQVG